MPTHLESQYNKYDQTDKMTIFSQKCVTQIQQVTSAKVYGDEIKRIDVLHVIVTWSLRSHISLWISSHLQIGVLKLIDFFVICIRELSHFKCRIPDSILGETN